jgi:hypothetical protein
MKKKYFLIIFFILEEKLKFQTKSCRILIAAKNKLFRPNFIKIIVKINFNFQVVAAGSYAQPSLIFGGDASSLLGE